MAGFEQDRDAEYGAPGVQAALPARAGRSRSGDEARSAASGAAAAARPRAGVSASMLLNLQRTAGNRATSTYLQREDGGEPESQAGHDHAGHDHADGAGNGPGGDAGASPVHSAVSRSGEPVDASTRRVMEPVLKTGLSDVQVVRDRASTSSVDATAFTVANKVVVNPDRFQSGTPQAQRTLFHELTHVKQQREGPVAGTPQAGGIQVSHPSDRFELEAERTADAVSAQLQREYEQI